MLYVGVDVWGWKILDIAAPSISIIVNTNSRPVPATILAAHDYSLYHQIDIEKRYFLVYHYVFQPLLSRNITKFEGILGKIYLTSLLYPKIIGKRASMVL